MAKKTKDGEGTLDDLKNRADQSSALNVQTRALFPEAKAVAKEDRRLSRGKMGLVEGAALRGVVDAIDLEPAVFATLADEDEGHDPDKLETDVLRDRIDRHASKSAGRSPARGGVDPSKEAAAPSRPPGSTVERGGGTRGQGGRHPPGRVSKPPGRVGHPERGCRPAPVGSPPGAPQAHALESLGNFFLGVRIMLSTELERQEEWKSEYCRDAEEEFRRSYDE